MIRWPKIENSHVPSYANSCCGYWCSKETELTFLIKSSNSSAVLRSSPLREVFNSLAISPTVSCKNLAYCILAFNRFLSCSYKKEAQNIRYWCREQQWAAPSKQNELEYKWEQPTCSFILSWKVEGNMLGNNLRATGSRNSIKGTIMNTANGTSRKISAVVRVNWVRSRRVKLLPPASLRSNREQIFTSAHSNLVPTQ